MALPHRHSTSDLRSPAGPSPTPTKPRPLSSLSSLSSNVPLSLTPNPRSSIPRPSPRTPQTPIARSSFHKTLNPNDSSTGLGLGVGLGFSSLVRTPRPSPPGLPNGRASPALRRSLSTLGRRPSGLFGTGVRSLSGPLGTSVPAKKRRKRKKKKDGSTTSSSSSSSSSGSDESSTANSSSGVEDGISTPETAIGHPWSIFMHGETAEPFTAKEFFTGTFTLFDPTQTGSVRIFTALFCSLPPLTRVDQYRRFHPALPQTRRRFPRRRQILRSRA